MNIEEFGHWEDDVFVLDSPHTMYDEYGYEYVIERLNFDGVELTDAITRDDAVHAILNPVKLVIKFEDNDD